MFCWLRLVHVLKYAGDERALPRWRSSACFTSGDPAAVLEDANEF
jgi:hypothetical protein